ncbi:MAG: hypothetical protein DMD92_13970 [Candidatus Rokuibacteriota bacterium]|nr:MAG: hypothetical protein DMD92_13970 [Candidatus Rokubacteria bacterium]
MGHSLRQHTLISTLGALVFAIAVGGCATASPSSAFQIPEEQFHSKVKRIALAPIAVPSQLGVSEPAKLRFDALIEAKLQEAGFTTFPATEWGEAFTRIQQEAGGLFDPRTGELDDAKVKTILLRTVEELRGRFQLDAILFPRVHVVKAKFTGAWARWDGASDSLTSGLSVLATSGISGTVPALTLVVSIDSPADELALYRRGAGIQVLEKLAPLTERLSGKWLAPVPREEVLANEERNLAAVGIALGPLLKKR